MKKIFYFFAVLMISSCVRLGEQNSFGFRNIVIGSDYVYTMSPLNYGEVLARTEEVTEEEFEEGKAVSALEGHPIYYLKRYIVTHTEKPVWMATANGTLKGMVSPVFIKADKEYQVIGSTVVDDVEYNIINPHKNELILIDKNGNIYNHTARRVGENKFIIMKDKVTAYPKDLKIRQIVSRTTKTDDPFLGMEVIYGGQRGEHYIMKYRDFDGSGHEQYRTVDFTEDYEIIDFDNLKIKVLSVTPTRFEGIVIK